MTATVVGSTCSFIVSRTVLSGFVKRLMEHDKRFAALALTLKYDGLALLCMIRLCPLPYSVCNGAISTFPTVHPLMYGLATLIISPKLLVPAFIGSRLRILSEENEKMGAGSKAVNIISIIVTVAIGLFTGLYIYRRYTYRSCNPHRFAIFMLTHAREIGPWPGQRNSRLKSALTSGVLYKPTMLLIGLTVHFQMTLRSILPRRLSLVMRKNGLASVMILTTMMLTWLSTTVTMKILLMLRSKDYLVRIVMSLLITTLMSLAPEMATNMRHMGYIRT